MSDIRVTPTDQLVNNTSGRGRQIVWVNALIGYCFYYFTATGDGEDVNEQGIWYVKTTDGGATWTGETRVNAVANRRCKGGPSVWFDQWTPGDLGTNIHICWDDCEETNLLADHFVKYRRLSITDDSLSTEINALVESNGSGLGGGPVDICKCPTNGTLYIINMSGCGSDLMAFLKSTDNGANWVKKTAIAGEAPPRMATIIPGNETDPDDIYMLKYGTLRYYDASANTWVTIYSGTASTDITNQVCLVINRTTKVSYGMFPTLSGGLQILKINDVTSVTLMTQPITSGVATSAGQLSIDSAGNLYALYPISSQAYYKKSSNSGATWDNAVRLDDDGLVGDMISAPAAGAYAGRLYAVWDHSNALWGNDGGGWGNGLFLELAFNQSIFTVTPTWTDVSSDLISFKTKRGRTHELDKIEAGMMDVVLNNAAGNWWRNNLNSLYYPYVKPLTLIRLRKYYEGVEHPVWYGVTEGFDHDFLEKLGGWDPVMKVKCVDIFKTLARFPIRPANPKLTVSASAGDLGVTVEDVSYLYAGQVVTLYDSQNTETCLITSIDTDTNGISFFGNLQHDYSTGNGARIKKWPKAYSGARIACVLLELGFPVALTDIDTGQVEVAELDIPVGGTNALEHIQAVAEAEDGIFFQGPDGKVYFQDSIARQTDTLLKTVQAVFSDKE